LPKLVLRVSLRHEVAAIKEVIAVVVVAVAIVIAVVAVAVVPAVRRRRLRRRRRPGRELLADRDLDFPARDRGVHVERVLVRPRPGERDRPLPDGPGLPWPLTDERRLLGAGQPAVRVRARRGHGDQHLVAHARVSRRERDLLVVVAPVGPGRGSGGDGCRRCAWSRGAYSRGTRGRYARRGHARGTANRRRRRRNASSGPHERWRHRRGCRRGAGRSAGWRRQRAARGSRRRSRRRWRGRRLRLDLLLGKGGVRAGRQIAERAC